MFLLFGWKIYNVLGILFYVRYIGGRLIFLKGKKIIVDFVCCGFVLIGVMWGSCWFVNKREKENRIRRLGLLIEGGFLNVNIIYCFKLLVRFI